MGVVMQFFGAAPSIQGAGGGEQLSKNMAPDLGPDVIIPALTNTS